LSTRSQEYEVLTRDFQTRWTRALLAEMRIQNELREALNSPCMLASEAEQTAWIVKVKSLNNLWTAATATKRKISAEFFDEAADYRLGYEDLLEFWKVYVAKADADRNFNLTRNEHGPDSPKTHAAFSDRRRVQSRKAVITKKLKAQWEVIQRGQTNGDESESAPISD